MENRNEDYLGMLNVVENVWINKQSVLGSIIVVKEAFLEVIVIKEAIIEMATKQSTAIGGKTIDKKVLRKNMSELSAQIGQIVAAYAFTVKDEDLKKNVNFPISYYNGLRDEAVIFLVNNVIANAEAKLIELADYGITLAMVDMLKSYLSKYSGNTQSNTYDVTERKGYTKQLRELFHNERELINNKLDKVMMIFQFSNPDVYQLYVNARNSMPTHHAKKSNGEITDEEAGILSGIVTDKADGNPIQGATINLKATDFTTQTDSDGEYMFDTLPAGTYNVEVIILDYQTATLAAQIVVAGDETIADFEMTK